MTLLLILTKVLISRPKYGLKSINNIADITILVVPNPALELIRSTESQLYFIQAQSGENVLLTFKIFVPQKKKNKTF